MNAGYALLDRIIIYIIDPAILLIFSIGFLLFIWGLVLFIFNPEDAGRRKKGLDHMIWGIVGMFVMIAVEGLINLIVGTFDLEVPPSGFSGGGRGATPPAGGFPTL